jgi:hypothetical protein
VNKRAMGGADVRLIKIDPPGMGRDSAADVNCVWELG